MSTKTNAYIKTQTRPVTLVHYAAVLVSAIDRGRHHCTRSVMKIAKIHAMHTIRR